MSVVTSGHESRHLRLISKAKCDFFLKQASLENRKSSYHTVDARVLPPGDSHCVHWTSHTMECTQSFIPAIAAQAPVSAQDRKNPQTCPFLSHKRAGSHGCRYISATSACIVWLLCTRQRQICFGTSSLSKSTLDFTIIFLKRQETMTIEL